MLPDKASLSGNYGGPYVQARPVEQPQQEVSDTAINQAMCDTAMMTHTASRAWVTFNGHTYSGGGTDSITVVDHDAVWGSGTGVKPTVGQTNANTFVITWAASQVDELGASHTLNIRYVHEPMTVDTALSRAKVTGKTANTITIQTFNAAGSANGLSGIPIFVEWE